jgi:hypothetical protein
VTRNLRAVRALTCANPYPGPMTSKPSTWLQIARDRVSREQDGETEGRGAGFNSSI